jgi:uncharacterized protein YxeA
MKKSQIIILSLFTILIFSGCTNNQNKQLQQQNDLLNQQNMLLQQQVNQQDTNTTMPSYTNTIDNVNPINDTNTTGNTKTIPFDAVGPANNNNTF